MLNYVQGVITTATGIVTSTTALTFNVVGRIFSAIVAIIVVYFMSLYMTKDMPVIRGYFQSLFPSSFQPELAELMRRIGYIWAAFFRGQLVLSFAIGSITWVVLTLVGMPGALVLAITAGVLEVIPQFGPIIATIPAVIVALIQGSPVLAEYGVGNVGFALLIVGIYFVIQQLEGSILVPRIIGDSVNLHPVVVITGVMVGLSTFGILGAFLAAPTMASIRVVGGYVHAKLLDYPPFLKPMIPDRRRQPYRKRVRGDQPGIEATLKAAQSATQTAPSSSLPLPELPPGSPAEPKEIGDTPARTSTVAR
jgi:predicted PurR-regulated permease PerM